MTERPPPPVIRDAPDYPPELPAETPSGLHRARVTELNWQGAKLTIAMAVVAVGTAFGAYRVVLSEAAAQTDAGLKGHESRLTAVEQNAGADRAQNNTRFQRLEDGQLRTDKKLDALLDRLNVQNPAPTPVKDAGP